MSTQTATINSGSFSQLTDLITRSFQEWLDTMPQVMRKSSIVVETLIPKGTGDTKRFAERIQGDQYASTRDEGDSSKQGKAQYGYEKDGQVHTVSLAISITERMRSAGKEQMMLDKITSLSEVCPNTMDLDLAHRLTFAFATSYTDRDGRTVDTSMGDGLAMISASHTLTGSGVTYSNLITANPQFSQAALETAEKSFAEESYDNLGLKVTCIPDTIITTDDPNTINEVRRLLNATADVEKTNSGTFNVYANKYKHLPAARIATTATGAVDTTKRKYWFLAASRQSDLHLGVLNEPYLKTPAAGNNWEDFLSENWNYTGTATYLIAWVTGKWIRGSNGSWS